MREPGTAYDDPQIGRDLQVGSMADYVVTDTDNGGVHINSGFPIVPLPWPLWTLAGTAGRRLARFGTTRWSMAS